MKLTHLQCQTLQMTKTGDAHPDDLELLRTTLELW